MTAKRYLFGLALAGLLVLGGRANAASYSFSTNDGTPGTFVGAWDVVLSDDASGLNWSVVSVTPQAGAGVHWAGKPNAQSSGLDFTFEDGLGNVVAATTTAVGGPDAAHLTWLGGNISTGTNTIQWHQPVGAPLLNNVNGGLNSMFATTGSFTLSSKPSVVNILVHDHSGGWSGALKLPEPSTAAMVLPLLAPLGLVLRRRRTSA